VFAAQGVFSVISIVNGYICTTSCEVASAKQGKDPSAPLGSALGASGKNKNAAFAGQPATVLDGSLAKISDANPTVAQQPRLDRLA
jgi:hypothetical protein